MQKNDNKAWDSLEKSLASEIISGRERVSKAKDFAIGCLTVAVIVISVSLSIINYKNDMDWRELFSSYDYVSQDGEGINNINTGEQGDLLNGTESKN